MWARIGLMILALIVIIVLIKVKANQRIGSQFFGILVAFWSMILIISIYPNVLDSVLNSTGLVNRSQFLLGVALTIIIYLLVLQFSKSKNISLNLSRIVRESALTSFHQNYGKIKPVDVVIVIVAKNEARVIGNLIEQLNAQNFPFSYKIVVINDGSTDDTKNIAQSKGAIVVDHIYNLGIGGATKTGFLIAKEFESEIIINIDGDGQHDPKYILKLISKLKDENWDLVYGSRFNEKSVYNTSSVRKIGNKFYTYLVNRIGKMDLTDVTSGYRCMKSDKIQSIYFVAETNFAIELAVRAAKAGLKVGEIPTKAISRIHGQSQFQKLDRFVTYHINAIIQIFNASFRSPEFK